MLLLLMLLLLLLLLLSPLLFWLITLLKSTAPTPVVGDVAGKEASVEMGVPLLRIFFWGVVRERRFVARACGCNW